MDKEIEVTETTTVVDVSLKDQVVVTLLSAVVGLLATKLTERGYFAAKGRWQIHRATSNRSSNPRGSPHKGFLFVSS